MCKRRKAQSRAHARRRLEWRKFQAVSIVSV
jgi:hypothetical protein